MNDHSVQRKHDQYRHDGERGLEVSRRSFRQDERERPVFPL